MGWKALALGALGTLCTVVTSVASAQYEERFKLLNHESWRKGWPTGEAPEVLDRKTRLVWRRSFEESSLGDGTNDQYDRRPFYTWETAVERASFVAAKTGKPWRLPSIDELAALMSVIRDDRLADKSDIDFVFTFKTELRHIWIWSGTRHKDPKFAWYVNYNFGKPAYYYRAYQGRVRLVRPAEPRDYSGGPCSWVQEPRKKPELVCPADLPAQRSSQCKEALWWDVHYSDGAEAAKRKNAPPVRIFECLAEKRWEMRHRQTQQLLATMTVPSLPDGHMFSYGMCEVNGRLRGYDTIAIVRKTQIPTWTGDIRAAWRVDPVSKTFAPAKLEGLKCYNSWA